MTTEQKQAIQKHKSILPSSLRFKEARNKLIHSIIQRETPDWGGFRIKFFDYEV